MNLAIANTDGNIAIEGFPPSLSMISGSSGMGKSTTAATWPAPVAFAFDLNGLRYLTVPGENGDVQLARIEIPVDITTASSRNHVAKMSEFLRSQIAELAKDSAQTFSTVIIDTVDDMYAAFRDAFMYDKGLTEFIPKDHTSAVSDAVWGVLQAMFNLVSNDYHVVVVAHTAEKDAEVGNLPVHTLQMPQKLTDKVFSRIDQGFFMIPPAISKEAAVESAKNPDEIGGGANRLLAKSTGRHPSKDRSGRLPKMIPATFDAINAAFAGQDADQFQPNITSTQVKMISTKGAAYWKSRNKK